MKWKTWMLLILTLTVSASATHLTQLEKEYGPNIVTIQRQAMVEWVKDNKQVFYDAWQMKNHYVSQLNDEKMIHMLRHEPTREANGLDEANLTPYIKQVKKHRGLMHNQSKVGFNEDENSDKVSDNMNVTNTSEKKEDEEPMYSSKVECVRENRYTIYDPLYRMNRWIGWMSNSELERVIESRYGFNC